jgi:hypothetical protein
MGSSSEVSTVADTNTNMDSGSRILREEAVLAPGLEYTSVARVTVGWRVLPGHGYPIVGYAPGCAKLYIVSTHNGINTFAAD